MTDSQKRGILTVISLVLLAWVVCPDPLPIVVDDILAGVGAAITGALALKAGSRA